MSQLIFSRLPVFFFGTSGVPLAHFFSIFLHEAYLSDTLTSLHQDKLLDAWLQLKKCLPIKK